MFELVPPTFAEYATELYKKMGKPDITRENVWAIYLELLDSFHQMEEIPESDHGEWYRHTTLAREDTVDPIALLDGLQELPQGIDRLREDGSYYMGGVNNGEGLGRQYFF